MVEDQPAWSTSKGLPEKAVSFCRGNAEVFCTMTRWMKRTLKSKRLIGSVDPYEKKSPNPMLLLQLRLEASCIVSHKKLTISIVEKRTIE